MFADLLKRLSGSDTDQIEDEDDARLALSALLVRIARSDGEYDPQEMARIDRILMTRFDLSAFDAATLRAEAEEFEAQAPDTVRFTRAIKDGVPYDDRIGVIEAMWSVVMADGERDDEESSIMRTVSSFLGVNDRDSNMARRRVEDRTG